MIRAAGILFLTEDDQILLLRRSGGSSQPGTWCIPGGGVEDGESAVQAAEREALEETGWARPEGTELIPWTRAARDGVDFTTYMCRVPAAFPVVLNDEHTEHAWVPRAEIGQRFARADDVRGFTFDPVVDIDYRPDDRDERPIVTIYASGEIRVRAPK